MKAGAFAIAASALLGTVVAGSSHNRRHAHEAFHLRNVLEAREPTCTCTSTVTVYVPEATSTELSTVLVSPTALSSSSTSSTPATVPTPFVTTFTSTGVYTIPASTITLTSTVTVPAATSTVATPGVQTIGGVTTVVPSATTITVPLATVLTNGSTTTTTIYTTTYVCPSSGTYTIAPTTTTLNQTSTVIYPSPTTYFPGTYTQTATTVTIVETSDVFVCPFATPAPNTTYSSSIPTYTPASSSAASTYIPSPSVNSTSAAVSTSTYVPSTSSSAWSSSASSSSASSSSASSSSASSSSASSSSTSSWSSSASPSSSSSSWSSSASSSASSSSTPSSTSSSGGWSVSASASASGSVSASISANGNLWAMAYTPYTSSGSCKDAGTVSSDIAAIAGKGFKAVRLYSTDCSGLENVGSAARQNGLKIIVGIFISSSGISGAQSQVQDIVNWAQWDLVEMIVIGNEAIFNGYCSASDLANFISSCKSTFSGAGYTGVCTTTEPLNVLQENTGSLCGVIDVVAANLHPFFNSDIAADMAGAFVAAQLKLVELACPGKDAYNLETGWPSAGSGSNGAAVPGTSEQSTAIQQITQAAGSKSVMFSWENDYWKQPGEFGVEQNWGCGNLFSGN